MVHVVKREQGGISMSRATWEGRIAHMLNGVRCWEIARMDTSGHGTSSYGLIKAIS